MKHAMYLIIGGGMAADGAVRGIRDVDKDGSIVVVGAEADPPYKRPWLTKALWKGKPVDKVWSKTDAQGAELITGRDVLSVDTAAKTATDDHGDVYGYEKALFATGATPRPFPAGGDDVINYRSLDDYRRLRALTDAQSRFAVIGGGFIGSELAAGLRMNEKDVTLFFPGETLGDRVYPADLGRSLNEYYREKGVTVRNGHEVTGIERKGSTLRVTSKDVATGREEVTQVDGIVSGIGVTPNTEVARNAGLKVDNGIEVNEFLQTSAPDVYAAGDVASFWQEALGTRRRVEHEDNAKTMGRAAGRNMAGQAEPYTYLPMFYSDLFDLGYEAVGELDARLDTVEDWSEPFRAGVIYYLKDDVIRGVLLWNVWEQVDKARALITAQTRYSRLAQADRLPTAS